MVLCFLIVSLLAALFTGLSRNRCLAAVFAFLFYAAQLAFALWIVLRGRGETVLSFFTLDNLGAMFHLLTAVIAPVVYRQSLRYLDTEPVREFRIYSLALIGLCLSVTGVYYADNAAVTWIFLEATTLATAALVYHRRTARSLEATWKYLFVSSVGIAVAYLGILLLSTAVTGNEGLSYRQLLLAVPGANPLYMKVAFLLILTGYSCKMEVFPLYTVGVDANYAAPTPASALISTALVNAGFVAFFRIYRVMAVSEVYDWCRNVLILAGLLSLLAGAVYLRRTNNYKRFLSYSTVENLGIVLIGLGVGGIGVFAALFHLAVHSLLKAGMFLQIAQVGRFFGTYRMNRTGNYLNLYRIGGATVMMGLVGLLAFPPSGLFVSEFLIFREMIATRRWWLLTVFVLLMCLVVYTLCRRFAGLAFRPEAAGTTRPEAISRTATWLQIALMTAVMVAGIVQPRILVDFINGMLM